MTTTIRQATPEDAEQILEVRLSVRENVLTPQRLEELGIHVESVAEMIRSTHSTHCAFEGDRMVGFSMGDLAAGVVFALFVRPDSEGTGLGKRLLGIVVEELWQRGHPRLTLGTGPGTRAYTFYQRQGWRPTGRMDGDDEVLELLR